MKIENDLILLSILEDNENQFKELISNLKNINIFYSSNSKNIPKIFSNRPPFFSLAIYFKSIKIINFLKKIGISQDMTDKVGRNPIHFGAMSGNIELIDNYETKLSIKDNFDNLPIHYASMFGQLEICKKIWNLNFLNEFKNCLSIATRFGHLELVKFFVEECNLSINEEPLNGYLSPYHECCLSGHEEILNYFLTKKINLYQISSINLSSINYSIQSGNLKCFKILLLNGLNINGYNEENHPIIEASSFGYLDIIKFLINNNINQNYLTKDNKNPLLISIINNHFNLSKFLLNNNAIFPNRNDLLEILIKFCNSELLDLILNKFPNIINQFENI